MDVVIQSMEASNIHGLTSKTQIKISKFYADFVLGDVPARRNQFT